MSKQNRNNELALKSTITLELALKQDLNKIATCVSFEDFATALQNFELDSNLIGLMHKAMQNKLTKRFEKSVNRITEHEDVIDMHKQFNELLTNAISVEGTAWRPPRDVKKHMRSLYADVYIRQNAQLEEELSKESEKNNQLIKQIEEKRQEIETTYEKREHLMKDNDKQTKKKKQCQDLTEKNIQLTEKVVKGAEMIDKD